MYSQEAFRTVVSCDERRPNKVVQIPLRQSKECLHRFRWQQIPSENYSMVALVMNLIGAVKHGAMVVQGHTMGAFNIVAASAHYEGLLYEKEEDRLCN